MKIKTKKLAFLLVIGLVFPLILNYTFNFSNIHKPKVINPQESAGYSESFIHVDDNWTATLAEQWCNLVNGKYVIENVTINASSSPIGSGIFINNSKNEYFIIRNCTVYNAVGLNDAGIKLENTCNGTISNNNCSENGKYGIRLDKYCSNNTITGNTANGNDYGIYLNDNCDYNTISGNTANDNGNSGIYLFESDYNNITENNVNYNQEGIYIETSCDNNFIGGNNANNNTDSGIYIYEFCDNNDILGNTLCNNTLYGIYLADECMNNTISGNTINDNGHSGIYVEDECVNNTLSENTVNDNEYNGIYLYYYCGYNTISNNFVNNTEDYGISLHYCQNNTIIDNIANYNGDIGIELYDDNSNNTISNNVVSYNGLYGIGIEENSDNNTISNNVVSYNGLYGIGIFDYCDNNSIIENFFLKNGKHAFDDEIGNKWNSTTIGNYWDNWTSPDANEDGIVDAPYPYIGGAAESTDYLPIAEDGAPRITINSPNSGEGFGIIAPSFDVEITDIYVISRWYTIDGGLHNITFTENGVINQSAWDALDDGTVKLKFYASDIIGKIGSAEVSIIKDTIIPVIIINSPTEGERYGKSAPLFNITVTDDNLDIMWYSFDGGAHIYVITNNTVFNQTAWTALSEGDVTIIFYARDIAGNDATVEVSVIKSVPRGLDPVVIITIVIISVVGGGIVVAVVYFIIKKRAVSE